MPEQRYVFQPRIWFSLVLFGLLVFVVACGGGSSTTGTGTTPTAIANNPTGGTGNTPVSSSPTSAGTSSTATSQATPSPTSAARPTPSPTPLPRPTPSPTPLPKPTPSPTPRPTPSPTPKPPPPVTVVITTVSKGVYGFSPRSISVPPGTLVTWINKTAAPHTVTGGSFGSGTINPGGFYSFRFNSASSFGYHCSFHPYMTATVNVT